MKHVAIKARISSDDEGRGENVDQQIAWGLDYAARTLPDLPVEVYADNDISAADRDTERPEFNRLCGNIAAGLVAHIVCTNRNRITRDLTQWIDMVDDLLLPAGIEVIHTKHRGIQRVDDIATDIDAVLGRREIRVTRQLVLDKHAALAARGRPAGQNGLGFRHSTNDAGEKILVHDPLEAELLRWSAGAVLSGWSMTSIAREWDARRVPRRRKVRNRDDPSAPKTLSTTPWVRHPSVIQRALTKPSIAGLREHRGQTVTATWDPIIDEVTWRRVCAVLSTRTTAVGRDGKEHPVVRNKRPARRYLLTGGLARCGRDGCGAPLIGQQRTFHGSKAGLIPYYTCHPAKGGCSRIGIKGEPFEAWVVHEFKAKVRSAGFLEALAAATDPGGRLDELNAELAQLDLDEAELGRMWAAKTIKAAGWAAAQAGLDAQRAVLTGELAALPEPAGKIDPETLDADWEEATLEERRHLLGQHIVAVIVRPGRFGPQVTDDTMRRRVEIVWRAVR